MSSREELRDEIYFFELLDEDEGKKRRRRRKTRASNG
jgi:hypothetical protein